MTDIRRRAIDAGLHVYSKMESDDPDESPLEVALRVAADTAIAALREQHAAAVKALERYGRHDNDCDIHPGMPGIGACDCGFDAALPSPRTDQTKEAT